MQIVRNLNKHGNYNTKLFSLLKNSENIPVFNSEHGLRNPLGIYNIAFLKVLSSASDSIDLILNEDKTVNKTYKNFLESVNEFVDDGYNIIKCYYPKNSTTSTARFADKWLESINKAGIQNYKNIIEPYIKDTRYIVNKVKHEHGRLEQVYINTYFGTCSGYFLEKFNNESLEPDENVHKKFKKHSTAFSYFLDIMRNLAIVYIVSEKIVEYLERYVLPNNINYDDFVNENEKEIHDILKKLWKIPLLMFPDEYQKSFTIIDIDDSRKELIVKYPAPIYYINRFKRYTTFKAKLLTSGDGTSNAFAIPYLGI